MKCRKHPYDVSSAIGVCASCLRDRLLSVMAAQAEAEGEAEAQVQVPVWDQKRSNYHQKSDPQRPPAPPLSLHRSVHGGHQRFYSTPLVGLTGGLEVEKETKKKKSSNCRRWSSLFFGLFRSRSHDPDSNPDPDPAPGDSCTASPLWFSTFIPGLWANQGRTCSLEEPPTGGERKVRRDRDRGMSPARCSDDEDDGHFRGGSSGYSSESSQGWRQTPRRTPATVRKTTSQSRNVSGFVFCLSPLVRASPNRHWNPPEMAAVAGESRPATKARFPGTTSFCKNRSRKLADYGRQSRQNRRR